MKTNHPFIVLALVVVIIGGGILLVADGRNAGVVLTKFYDNLYAVIIDAFSSVDRVAKEPVSEIGRPSRETACGPDGCGGACVAKRVCLNDREVKITSRQCRVSYETCSQSETCRNGVCEARHPYVLAFWSPYIDALNLTKWNDYREAAVGMIARGFTHVGFRTVAPAQNRSLIESRLGELRANGLNISLIQTPGHIFLTKNDQLDPVTHPSNGLSLKFFDSPGLDVLNCSFKCDGEPDVCCNDQDYVVGAQCPAERATTHNCGCVRSPSTRALDPAYDGKIWEKELGFIDETLGASNLVPGDIALMDMEVWSRPSYVDTCYPNTLMTSAGRYSGLTLEARHDEYYDYRGERAIDVRTNIKDHYPDNLLLFFNENIPELANVNNTAVPPGSGDAPSPNIYRGSNLAAIEEYLDQGDYSGVYVWLSFSTVNSNWAGSDLTGDWLTLEWDPRITQKIGKLLKDEGVAGVIVYPGPTQHGVSLDYYYDHSQALIRGLVGGLDPGVLVENCSDGIDNNGDGVADEVEACAPPTACAPGDLLLEDGKCLASFTADSHDRSIGFRTQQAYGFSWEAMRTASSSPIPNYYSGDDPILFGPANTYTPTSRKLYRAIIPFDTSAIPDDSVIESAILKLVLNSYSHFGTNRNYATVVAAELQNAPLVTEADYGSLGLVEGVATEDRLYSAESLPSDPNISFELNTEGRGWINPLGWTMLGLKAGLDLEGVILGEYQFANFNFQSADSATDSPQLEIIYRPPLR